MKLNELTLNEYQRRAMSCERYAWRIVEKKTRLQETTDKLQEAVRTKLNNNEQIRLGIVSAVFHTLAWEYADKCISYATEHRIEQTKALTRAAKEARQEWERNMEKTFGQNGFNVHREQVKEIFERWQTDFAVMYFTVSNEYKRTMPGVPYEELSVNAITGMQVIKVFHKWAKEAGEVLVRRMGITEASINTKYMDKLYAILDAYAGNLSPNFQQDKTDFVLCREIFYKNVLSTIFNVNVRK